MGKKTYLKCSHGLLLISILPCQDCESEKQKNMDLLRGYVANKKPFELETECRHKRPLSIIDPCPDCKKEQEGAKGLVYEAIEKQKEDKRIPIYRGCQAQGGCFCSGKCKEIIGYEDPE